ncbi:hypothetical protein [Pararhizobium sp. LjRoot238]|uniref:hypothetical protein n=1 Tax=Pararhizobium sp. LjRoot238 TaxID=3342293 RepID=UPI003ECCDBB4
MGNDHDGLGGSLLLPDPVFDQPSFAFFRALFDEDTFGWLVCVGLLRLVGLFIIGARKNVTPWIRVFSACIASWSSAASITALPIPASSALGSRSIPCSRLSSFSMPTVLRMTPERIMQFQDISDLPPLATIAFGISLGIL